MKMHQIVATLFILFTTPAISQKQNAAIIQGADAYLNSYNTTFQKLYYADQLAQWKLNTRIVKGDTATADAADDADKLLAEYTGSAQNIDSAKKYLSIK